MIIPVPAVGIGQTRETDLDHCILNTLKNVRLQNLPDHPNSALFENYLFFLISAKTSFCYIEKSTDKGMLLQAQSYSQTKVEVGDL